METIFHQLIIETCNKRVFEAITEQNGLSKWWIADCTVKPELGFINHFRLENYVDNKMKVIDLQPFNRVEWECVQSEQEWIGTLITFEIYEHKGYTKLNFKHANWAEQTDFFASCNFHWARHLTMLKELCEKGVNQINQDTELKEIKKVKE